MTGVRKRGEQIRRYILENIEKHPATIARKAATHFGVSRQAINQHLQRLTAERSLSEKGKTRNRTYRLASQVEWSRRYELTPDLAEDLVWTNDVRRVIEPLPDNVLRIWNFCFTEMLNNAKDHSGGTHIAVHVEKTAAATEIVILDDGVGIFRKIQQAMNLLDERHAILELAKGKLTTDPANHTGQGIFFTSRMVDSFDILSGGVYFSHEFGKQEDWITEPSSASDGTGVWMRVDNHTSRTTKRIFDRYSSGEDYGFTKTVVPVRLAQYGNDQLVSRSQAKRILSRVELFKTVVFDFDGVPTLGQAFADQIFRVFAREHPDMQLQFVRANTEVKRMIDRARSGATG
jgi:DNA-binding transcriptional ArsR family regulator